MDIWHISGGRPLKGEVRVQGSKNASLPILAAAIARPMELRLSNVPELTDVEAALSILRHLGCRVHREGKELYIDSRSVSGCSIPSALMDRMRSSVIFMGALLCRCGEARLSPPGGCQLGRRPIDLHLEALRSLGAKIQEQGGGEIYCRADSIRPARIRLSFPSVGATENAMLCACAAPGESLISGAAGEPEIVALADFLNAAGGRISGAGGREIRIGPMGDRGAVSFKIIPDRIAAASYLCACAACGGKISLLGAEKEHLSEILHFLNAAGCDIISKPGLLTLSSSGRLRALPFVRTAPYPGFPTDCQPVLCAALLKAEGESRIREDIFLSRFGYLSELNKLGAAAEASGREALIRGRASLHGADMYAGDLRGGAAMIIAALSAQGESRVFDPGHVRRGYERLEQRLRALGAGIFLEI